MGDQPGDVAHLAAALDLGLAVQVELYQRVVERLAPFLDVIAEEIFHHSVGVMLDRAQRQTAHRPYELLKLARDAGVDRPMPRIVWARRDLVDEQVAGLRHEHLDREHPDEIELLGDMARDGLGPHRVSAGIAPARSSCRGCG